jgi:hypothetical protein
MSTEEQVHRTTGGELETVTTAFGDVHDVTCTRVLFLDSIPKAATVDSRKTIILTASKGNTLLRFQKSSCATLIVALKEGYFDDLYHLC